MPIIYEANDLAYGTPDGRTLQENLNFSVRNSQMLLIRGGNGCGKSTLVKTMLSQIQPQQGSIRCAIPQERIEYIPQLENTEIHLPLTLRDVLQISLGNKVSSETFLNCGLLTREHLKSAWNTASGGERKRTLLTRALLKSPSILVLDEPMNHLDHTSRAVMIQAMSQFLRSGGEDKRAIVMVCHQGLSQEEGALFDLSTLLLEEPKRGNEA